FKACLLKGRSNYISLRRWRRYLAVPCENAEELRFKLKVLLWLHTTESGDRSELRLQGREEVLWTHIASDPLDCVGVRCTAEDCGAFARARPVWGRHGFRTEAAQRRRATRGVAKAHASAA